MKFLVDAHTLLWALFEPHHLSAKAAALLADPDHEIFVCQASVWELVIKILKGKLAVAGATAGSIFAELDRLGFNILPISRAHIINLETLPAIHKDPFDRLLISQAIVEGLILITRDSKMREYPVQTVWK